MSVADKFNIRRIRWQKHKINNQHHQYIISKDYKKCTLKINSSLNESPTSYIAYLMIDYIVYIESRPQIFVRFQSGWRVLVTAQSCVLRHMLSLLYTLLLYPLHKECATT